MMRTLISLLLLLCASAVADTTVVVGQPRVAAPPVDPGELLTNGSLELYTGTQDDAVELTPSDSFTGWGVAAPLGNGAFVDSTATVHGGSNAAKLHRDSVSNAWLYQNVTVTPGTNYVFKFWTRSDTGAAVDYQVYDNIALAPITAGGPVSSGVTGTTYTEVVYNFTAPVGCTSVEVGVAMTTDDNTGYVDDLSLKVAPSLNLFTNGDLELFTGTQDNAPPAVNDAFTDWTVDANVLNDNFVDSTATTHGGSNAAKLFGAMNYAYLYRDVTVTASTAYTFKFWTRTDGSSDAVLYYVYDNTNVVYITPATSSGVTGTTYTEVSHGFSTPSGCTSIQVGVRTNNTSDADYVDDLSLTQP